MGDDARGTRATGSDPGGGSTRTAGHGLLVAGVIILLTAVLYAPSLGAGYIWDDDSYVTHNPTLRSLDGLVRIWTDPTSNPQYYPMVHTTYWVEHAVWGLRPAGYHLTNILLHGLGAVLVWLVLRRLEVPGALLAALLFAVHPVHVESVTWITERKNVLSGVFYLSALLAYLRFRPPADEREGSGGSGWWYGLALLLFMLALLSKTVTASLPAAILLLVWWKRGRVRWRDVVPLLPMFGAGLALGLFTAHLERLQVGATGVEWDLSVVERCLIAGRAVWFYASKLLWPHPLIFVYPRWTIDAGVVWQYAFPATAVLLVATLVLLRRRLGRGPLVAVLYFGGTLVPALGFINVYPMRYSFVADHFQYLASLGVLTLIAALATRLVGRLGLRRYDTSLAAVPVAALALVTWSQQHVYENRVTLWTATIARNPDAWIAHNNLGAIHFERNDLVAAQRHFEAALRIDPENSEARGNLGAVLMGRGDRFRAAGHLEAAVRSNPRNHEALYNLGRIHLARRELDRAAERFAEVVRQQPRYALAHNALGEVELARGRPLLAIEHFERALALAPDLQEPMVNLERARRRAGLDDP